MEKANLKNTTIFNAFKIFLYFNNNIPFGVTYDMSFLEYRYVDAVGSEKYNNEFKRKNSEKLLTH